MRDLSSGVKSAVPKENANVTARRVRNALVRITKKDGYPFDRKLCGLVRLDKVTVASFNGCVLLTRSGLKQTSQVTKEKGTKKNFHCALCFIYFL